MSSPLPPPSLLVLMLVRVRLASSHLSSLCSACVCHICASKLGHSRFRLACQIILTKELEGLEMRLPQATRNFYVDGHVPTPH